LVDDDENLNHADKLAEIVCITAYSQRRLLLGLIVQKNN